MILRHVGLYGQFDLFVALLSLRKDSSVLHKMGRYLSTSLSGGSRRAKLTWLLQAQFFRQLLEVYYFPAYLSFMTVVSQDFFGTKVSLENSFKKAVCSCVYCIASFEKYIFRQHPKDISFKSSENGKKESKYTRLTTKSLQWRTKTK